MVSDCNPIFTFTLEMEAIGTLLRIFGDHLQGNPNKTAFDVLVIRLCNGIEIMAVVWVVAPCSLVEVYWYFRSACCFHIRAVVEAASTSETSTDFTERRVATSQKTAIFILAIVGA
jgi:hypothetical protein